jgi:hypothetical protein
MKVLEANDTVFDFDITRCKSAETYQDMGLGKMGHLLSCNRNGTFCQGDDTNIFLKPSAMPSQSVNTLCKYPIRSVAILVFFSFT